MVKTTNKGDKQTVSTNAMFRRPLGRPTRTVKSNKDKAGKIIKSSHLRKSKALPEHSLATKFSESIEQSREHIYNSTLADFDADYEGLSQQLINVEEHFDQQHQGFLDAQKDLAAPLKNEEFRPTADGKQLDTVTLSVRMKKFQKTIDREQEELIRQWDEYVAVEAEIDRLTAEIPDEVEMLEEIEAEKARFVKMIDQESKASIKAMKESEKALRLKEKKAEDQFMAILRDDDY